MTEVNAISNVNLAESAPADRVRPTLAGDSDGPTPPFPIRLEGKVEHGFARGSKELGCPTANLPGSLTSQEGLERNGIYFGWACLEPRPGETSLVKEMVMSVGYNPMYGNKFRTIEVHVIHDYGRDFYDENLKIIILGFIRPEYNYSSKEDLIKDIEIDKAVSLKSLERPPYKSFSKDEFLSSFQING
ncbi:hypothetical protein BY996DRAFT_6418500 [Phakopsora pachyrhizi]|uniref:Riboflavin kinase n=1 Tax=Phakopsora pachyrhizi TaxID=170000 RepID=A0AAV0BSC1_PHAPC|nr:hypothetical protein BY996DRAFT_6418500 [Phakopsora pachyrhizi]CAH7690354.1 hypothetical protein PPACK8108_LOCUS25685 [Phakopsora pachyrhizi]